MRDRKKIELTVEAIKTYPEIEDTTASKKTSELILEILLDIRELLEEQKIKEEVLMTVCDHPITEGCLKCL